MEVFGHGQQWQKGQHPNNQGMAVQHMDKAYVTQDYQIPSLQNRIQLFCERLFL